MKNKGFSEIQILMKLHVRHLQIQFASDDSRCFRFASTGFIFVSGESDERKREPWIRMGDINGVDINMTMTVLLQTGSIKYAANTAITKISVLLTADASSPTWGIASLSQTTDLEVA
jgi:hypothetical protein